MKFSSNPEEWFSLDQSLEEERRFSHGEGCIQNGSLSGDYRGRLYVKRSSRGWEWYCHNCGTGGVKKYSIEEFTRSYRSQEGSCHVTSAEGRSSKEFRLPRQTNWSDEGWKWITRFLTEQEIERWGIYWTSEWWGKIVLPIYGWNMVFTGKKTCGYQLRKVLGEGPKYITQYVPEVKPIDRYWKNYQDTPEIVVVEDIVSAICVSRLTSAVALLGSPGRFPDPLAEELASLYSRVLVWLDHDKITSGKKYCDRLTSLFGLQASVIFTEKDPKFFIGEQMREVLDVKSSGQGDEDTL